MQAAPEPFLKAIAPYRDGLVVAVECMFTWYWLADLCAQAGIPFVLGHALYVKAIHGGKAKNDKIDSQKIARRPCPPSRHQTFTAVGRQRGLAKEASIHTLRHSSATHRLARGVSLHVRQARLGHQSPRTTARDAHRTPSPWDVVHAAIAALMADLSRAQRPLRPGIAAVLRRAGREDLERVGEPPLPSHRRAIEDLLACRTEALGGQLLQCDRCGQEHYVYHSCRNRRWATCHHRDPDAWLAERRQERLPGRSWHVVCTGPRELAERRRRHQQGLDPIGLRAAQARLKLAMEPPDGGGLRGLRWGPHPGLSCPWALPGPGRWGRRRPHGVAARPPVLPRARPGPFDTLSWAVAGAGRSGTA
jgi:hypothetical protein